MPRYTNHTLGPNEKILAEAHYHWFYWAKRIAVCAVILAFAVVLDTIALLGGIASIIACIICAIELICAFIVYQNDEMVITNHRVILKTGFFSRDVFEMQIQKVETVLVDQSIMGRFFDYGTIACRGTGGTDSKHIEIAAPLEFRAAFQTAVKESQSDSIRSEMESAFKAAAAPTMANDKLDEIIRLLHSIDSKLSR